MTSKEGRWVVLDCGKFPSEKNCKLKMMAPEDQVEEMLTLATQHAILSHGHQDSKELRDQIRACIDFE